MMVDGLNLGEGFGDTNGILAFITLFTFLSRLAGGDSVEDESPSEDDDSEGVWVGVCGFWAVKVGATVEVVTPVVTVISPTKKVVVGMFDDDDAIALDFLYKNLYKLLKDLENKLLKIRDF